MWGLGPSRHQGLKPLFQKPLCLACTATLDTSDTLVPFDPLDPGQALGNVSIGVQRLRAFAELNYAVPLSAFLGAFSFHAIPLGPETPR